jgi:hypothetical protein
MVATKRGGGSMYNPDAHEQEWIIKITQWKSNTITASNDATTVLHP